MKTIDYYNRIYKIQKDVQLYLIMEQPDEIQGLKEDDILDLTEEIAKKYISTDSECNHYNSKIKLAINEIIKNYNLKFSNQKCISEEYLEYFLPKFYYQLTEPERKVYRENIYKEYNKIKPYKISEIEKWKLAIKRSIKNTNGIIYELCPNCNNGIIKEWNFKKNGYVLRCPVCGEKIKLYDACQYYNSVFKNDCDFDVKTENRKELYNERKNLF